VSTRDACVQKIEAQIDDWNADITRLEAKAGQASDDAWDELQASADDFWERTKAAFAAAKAEFQD